MRRKDREVHDKLDIFDILRRCDTVRIAMQGAEYPYVVPVSFGLEIVNGSAVIYFHCAQQGMKLDLLEKNSHVCVEGDIFINVEKTAHGITARSESVIGFGKCRFIKEKDEILHGLKLLTEHYGYADYPLDRCAGLQHLLVGKIVLEEITGKKNLPGTMTPADKAVNDHN
jgi:nitroimidazol reductase NimA-like FMN-containing flavoprotein (pyridoxamine 5'-phosphate oxidase superfamily)